MENLILKNGIILTPFEELREKVLFLKEGRIYKLISDYEFHNLSKDYTAGYKIIDVKGNYISPGFIDIHTHGANGADAVRDSIEPMADFVVRYGVTGFLATIWTAEFDKMVNACKRISSFIKTQERGARVLGINSEGPYLNADYGAQKPELVKIPEFKEYSRLVEACDGNLKVMTVAPELENAYELIKYLRENDVAVSIGHTDIKLNKLHEALNLGIGLITHIFNAMGAAVITEKGVKPAGIQEELLLCDELMSEVMADRNAVHVNPTLLKILIRCKGVKNIILITDSMNMTGSPPGKYYFQDGRGAIISEKEDVLRLEDGVLAGSIMTMNKTIKNMVAHTGIPLKDAIMMASSNPAKALKISNRKGEIKVGLDADIAVIDKYINVSMTIVGGEIFYKNNK
jgi:N-acetylglucosamine-6-phosphate deacetylase